MTLRIVNPTCEYKRNPLGLDVRRPRLGWQLQADGRHVLQTAYQIQVFDEAGDLLWDSGRVASGESGQIAYGGPDVRPRARYEYQVRAWDNKGNVSPWSERMSWETGLLSPDNWQAEWISAGPADGRVMDPCDYMRTTFVVTGRLRSARVYATALGLYELRLNGRRASDALFTPGWTSYRERLQYQAYDVTELLGEGRNAIGVIVGNGWYRGPLNREMRTNVYGARRAALVQLHLRYEDGREDVVATGDGWTVSEGPIRHSEIYDGEWYDATRELPGWDTPSYDDGAWRPAATIRHDKRILIGQENEPTRIVERRQPAAMFTTPAGERVLDMGQNMVGWVRFRIEAPRGTTVTLQHAEVLDADGNFYTANLREARQRITYVCKGEGVEAYEPRFTFHGFRYVKLEGFPESVTADQFTGCVIHTDMAATGEFECSDPLVNRLQHNIVWSQKGNFLDVPTDCPQRNERLGWVGDAQIFIRTAGFNMDVASFFAKWLHDLKADQREDGAVPDVVPNIWDWEKPGRPSAIFPKDLERHSSSAWGDAAVICPWTLYLLYGDKRILEEQFDSMKARVDYIRRQGDDEYLWNTGFHYGDWLALDSKPDSYLGATPNDLIATAFYAYSTELVAKAAEALGREEDARAYGELHGRIVQAFRQEFVTQSGRLVADTQTAHVLALMFGLVGAEHRRRVADRLAALVRAHDVHLTTGFVGTPYLCLALSQNGYHDLACELVMQTDYPSWLYAVTKGATTIWEHWDSLKPDGSFWSVNMNSFNHYAYGSIGEWFYRIAAGLDIAEPGYRRFRVAPQLVRQWTYARLAYRSVYGEIRTGWQIEEDGGRMRVEVAVPANTTAEVVLPGAARPEAVLESGAPAPSADGVLDCRAADNGTRLTLGSGVYVFTYPLR